MPEEKKEALTKLREALDTWEQQVTVLGNECAWTDRILDNVPEYVATLTSIPGVNEATYEKKQFASTACEAMTMDVD